MPENSPPTVFFGQNAKVNAWGVVHPRRFPSGETNTQARYDELSFIDGYNLYIDSATENYATEPRNTGAIRFKFVTPMVTNKYKVFLQITASSSLYTCFAHVLNSVQYPKTKDGFWVRTGYYAAGSNPTISSSESPPYNTSRGLIHNIRLFSSARMRLGVVVL